MRVLRQTLGTLAISWLGLFIALCVAVGVARAQDSGDINGGGSGSSLGALNGLYCQLTGCSMAGDVTFASTKGIVFNGGPRLQDDSGSGRISSTGIIRSDSGFWVGGILVSLTSSGLTFSGSGAPTLDGSSATATMITYKAKASATATTLSHDFDTGSTSLFSIYGAGLLKSATTTKVITNPTDTATVPDSSMMNISATAAAAWTPSETGAIDGTIVRACNTGTFAITMTASAGVYQGPGSVLGQFDCVTFRYQTDRFVELAFSNN